MSTKVNHNDGNSTEDPRGVPSKLYKFRSWNDQFQKQLLKNRVVWFASRNSLNDPFDCAIPMLYGQMTKDQFVRFGVWLKQQSGVDPSDAHDQAVARSLDHPLRLDPSARLAQEMYAQHNDQNYGVLSFTTVLDDIRIWSHYADCHRGFSVEFDAEMLHEQFGIAFDADPEERCIIGDWIKYRDGFPELIPTPENFDDISDLALKCKSSVWKYESEYRFIWAKHPNTPQYVDRNTVSAIYLGCSISENHKKEIVTEANSSFPDAVVYQMAKKEKAFSLEFARVESP